MCFSKLTINYIRINLRRKVYKEEKWGRKYTAELTRARH